MSQTISLLGKFHARRIKRRGVLVWLICLQGYGMERPTEGCGGEEKRCCMQQKRCGTLPSKFNLNGRKLGSPQCPPGPGIEPDDHSACKAMLLILRGRNAEK